jgi:hypothetical protein
VRNWATQSKMGVTTNQAKRVQNRPSRTNVHKEDRAFIFNFLEKLPKLPWHYCRKATNNLYLEKTFKTVSDVYNLYKNQCEESSLKNMSLTSFMKAIDEKNITCLQINLYLEQPMEVQLFATFLQRRK